MAKGKLESLSTEITEQDNSLFMANGLRLKPGMQCKHSANQEFLKNTSSIQSTVEETLELLQKAKQRVERILKVDEETLNDEDYILDHEDLIVSAVSSIKVFEVQFVILCRCLTAPRQLLTPSS